MPKRIGTNVNTPSLSLTTGPFAKKDFRLFFVSFVVSLSGSSMTPLTMSFAVFKTGGGVEQISKVLAVEALAIALFLLPSGILADQIPRRYVMMTADLLRFAIQAFLATLLFENRASLPYLMIASALLGLGNALYLPCRLALISDLVEPGELQLANAMLAACGSVAAIVGPCVGGLLVDVTGPTSSILIDALTYLASAICLYSMSIVEKTKLEPGKEGSPLRQLIEGWSEFRSRIWLWLIVIYVGLFHLLVYGPLMVLGCSRFAHVAHGAILWGSLLGSYGTGALFGSVVALYLKPIYPLRVALLIFLCFALVPAALALPVSLLIRYICFFLGGTSITIFSVVWQTTIQQNIQPEKLSRICSYDALGSICLLPAGYALSGPMAEILGLDGALGLAAIFSLFSTLIMVMQRDIYFLMANKS